MVLNEKKKFFVYSYLTVYQGWFTKYKKNQTKNHHGSILISIIKNIYLDNFKPNYNMHNFKDAI